MDKKAINYLLTSGVNQHLFPGCALGLTQAGETKFFVDGKHTYDEQAPLVSEDTLYDIASITKSIPTTFLTLQLIKVGKIGIDDVLETYLAETKNKPLGRVTIRQLLSFTPQFPFTLSKLKEKTASEVLGIIINSDWSLPKSDDHPVSNAIAILLTLVLERVTGQSLDRLADEAIFRPLGMTRTTFYPERFALTEIAPTEIQDWRGGLIHGQVHDESAWVLRSKMIAGSAGLFSCVADLMKFAKMVLRSDVLQDGLGWEIHKSWMSTQVSSRAFGKTGFTGCFLLFDPLQDKGLVFLSNCVYPHRPVDRHLYNQFRQNLCELVFDQSYEIT